MGKEIPRVAQDEHKTGELTQAWMIDKTPINLRLFPRKKSEGMINLLLLVPKRACILDYKGLARIYPPVFQHVVDLMCSQRRIFGKPTADQ
jgi:hypothetical protein